MATGKSLVLREIQPHPRWRGYEPNPYRVQTRSEAKRLRISRRRYIKMLRRAAQAS